MRPLPQLADLDEAELRELVELLLLLPLDPPLPPEPPLVLEDEHWEVSGGPQSASVWQTISFEFFGSGFCGPL